MVHLESGTLYAALNDIPHFVRDSRRSIFEKNPSPVDSPGPKYDEDQDDSLTQASIAFGNVLATFIIQGPAGCSEQLRMLVTLKRYLTISFLMCMISGSRTRAMEHFRGRLHDCKVKQGKRSTYRVFNT